MFDKLMLLLAQLPAQTPQQNPEITRLLAELKDPVLPEQIGLWPPAVGWWVLLVILLIGITSITVLFFQQHRARRYRREALHALQNIQDNTVNDPQLAGALAALLKQTFITASPGSRNLVAQFYGTKWRAVLHTACSMEKLPYEQQTAFNGICGEHKYQAGFELDKLAVFKACRYWIARHKQLSHQQIAFALQQKEAK